MFEVILSRQAKKFLDRDVPKSYYRVLTDHLLSLSSDPHPQGSIKLKGSEDLYRLRVGVYRIIYSIEHEQLVVQVISIGHRKDVYN